MPVQVFEDSLDLHIDLLDEDGYTAESWPYPKLKKQGESETRRFKVVILENEYLRLTFIPALGGRLWELFDKRCQRDALTGNWSLKAVEKGPRGVEINRGMLLSRSDAHDLGSLGNVDLTVLAPESEEEEGAVLFGHFGHQSFSCKYSLNPGYASFRLDVSIQNRSLRTHSAILTTVLIHTDSLNEQTHKGGICTDSIAISYEPGTFAHSQVGLAEEPTFLSRSIPNHPITARQTDSFSLLLQPFFGLDVPTYVGEAGVGSFAPPSTQFAFCASTQILGHKIVVGSTNGQTYEAPVDLFPEKVYAVDLSSIPDEATHVQIKSLEGVVLASLTKSRLQAAVSPKPLPTSKLAEISISALSDAQLLNLTSDFTLRVPAYLELAARATQSGDFQRADTCYEHALLFNGDDPLAWWAKAVNRRIGRLGQEGEERTELLNAHFLSPLEPCLRAEAFLAQPRNHGKDPSPLLASFDDVPENFVEVACQLIQARFFEEAAYFIDEALRHQNLAMLHYLHAYLLTQKGGMDIEVANLISKAEKAKLPPMPYRDLEREVLTKLAEKHPLPAILTQWLADELP